MTAAGHKSALHLRRRPEAAVPDRGNLRRRGPGLLHGLGPPVPLASLGLTLGDRQTTSALAVVFAAVCHPVFVTGDAPKQETGGAVLPTPSLDDRRT